MTVIPSTEGDGLSTGGVLFTAFFASGALFPFGRIIYVLRTNLGHKTERVIRNIGVGLMFVFLAETMGMLFWGVNHGVVLKNGHYKYDVPADTANLLSNISWGLAAGWASALFIAWLMKRRRLRLEDADYFLTRSALRQEYGDEEASNIDKRTGLTQRWLRSLTDDM